MEAELEKSLLEVGFRLASPPSDVAALLDLLDQTEIILSRVGQTQSESMLAVVHPSRTTLVAQGLLRHSDINVRVAVVSCISQILRIMAPDPPYEDGQMKVIFEMMVEAFQKLDEESSQSYLKRVSILEIAAKVKCCIMMLDLDCDALIIEMFCSFLKTIRPNHPAIVFTSMESIMTLLLEESDDIPPNLLSCLLESVKKCDKGVQTVAQRLGEKVISNCSAKLKPHLVRVLSPFVPNKYTNIIASICQENAGALEQNETNISGDALFDGSKLSERPGSDELPQETVDMEQDVKFPEHAASADKSPMLVMSHGTVPREDENFVVEPSSSKQKPRRPRHSRTYSVNLEPMQTRGRKHLNDGGKEAATVSSKNRPCNMDIDRIPVGGPSGKEAESMAMSLEHEDENDMLEKTATSTIDSEMKLKEMAVQIGRRNTKNVGDSSEKKNVSHTKQLSRKITARKYVPRDTSKISETPQDESIPDQSLVGSKIKVWWPDDRRYYDGQVSSFDFESGKHTILYDDGDREVLLLREERFKLLGSHNEMKEEDQEDDLLLPLTSLVSRKKKAIANLGSDKGVTSESLKSGQGSHDKNDTIPKKSRRPKDESAIARLKSSSKDRSRTSKMDKKTMIVYSKTSSKSKTESTDTDTDNIDAHKAKPSEGTCKSMTESTDMGTDNSDAHKAKPNDDTSEVRRKPITPKLSALEKVKDRFYESPSEAEESGTPTEVQEGQSALAPSKRKRNPNPKYSKAL